MTDVTGGHPERVDLDDLRRAFSDEVDAMVAADGEGSDEVDGNDRGQPVADDGRSGFGLSAEAIVAANLETKP